MPALLEPTPDGFLRGGEPHQIVSGAIHYFRVHPDQWRDRLRRLVAMGCDTVETYVAWNIHQPDPETVTFEGIADLGRFLDIAAEEGLDAIVRPGPFICAEWENGGFPGWVLRDRAMRLRVHDEAYLRLVDDWFDRLIPVIAQRQACRGGNVVMVQVENEYGSYGDDTLYLAHLRDGLRARGIEELLVTSDGPARMWLTAGTIDGALPTVNFGSRTQDVLEMAARELPAQPLMCMEFWNGWFDHWGEEHHSRDAGSAAAELEDMLAAGMSVNFYMALGGTNFGLTAGANHDGVLQPTTTSYDYDAPIAEDGRLTEKFHAFREVIGRHRDLPPLSEQLAELGLDAEPAALGARGVQIERVVPLRTAERFTRTAPTHVVPPAFEDVGLERGLLRYSRDIEIEAVEGADGADGAGGARTLAPLKLYGLADRAWVYVDGIAVGSVGVGAQRSADGRAGAGTGTGAEADASVNADAEAGTSANADAGANADADDHLDDATDPAVVELAPFVDRLLPEGGHRTVRVEILVENLGRVNFGPYLGGRKGILRGVWDRVRFLGDWEADPWPLEEMGEELARIAAETPAAEVGAANSAYSLPVLVAGSFEAEEPADAHLDLSGAGHGVAYVNGHCVGRYWSIGPQQSLYVPAPWIREGRNEVLLLDLDAIPARLALADRPVFD